MRQGESAAHVAIVITTRNRRDELVRALESCVAQDYPVLEILVFDDASEDDSANRVRALFPNVKVIRHDQRAGLIVRRNQGFKATSAEYVISIDDDAYFTHAGTVSSIVAAFERYPTAVALALPFVQPEIGHGSGFMTPLEAGTQLRSYIGCAHAVRREAVLQVGGYRELLVHQGEERDLAIRLLDHGWSVVYAECPPLVHLYSANREHNRVNFYGYRNTLLFTGLNVPQPHVIPRLLIDSAQLLCYRFGVRTVISRLRAIGAGWLSCAQYRRERRAVRRTTYARYRGLPGHGPLAPEDGRVPAPLTRKALVAGSK